VNNSNLVLHHISHRFWYLADYWSKFWCWRGVHLFNAFVRAKSQNSGLRNLASRN